jgi:hypothetical protein
MEISNEHRTEIEEIMERMECPTHFKCYRSGFENICTVKTVVPGKLIECLDENGKSCTFGLHYGSAILCQCPLRNYVAKNLGV